MYCHGFYSLGQYGFRDAGMSEDTVGKCLEAIPSVVGRNFRIIPVY